jgi:acyl-homoserine-lactone acylase
VAPGRTADGHALLVQSRQVSFVAGTQPLEVNLRSASGWHVRGIADPGVPLPLAGHNERIAWAHTDSPADGADVYAVAFDDAADPLMYRHDDEWRRATEWEDTVLVNTAQGVVPRVVRFRRTHHGPVVARREGRALAMRSARMADGGSLQQWLAMGRARDLEQFRAALEQRALPGRTTMYADADGNILYVRGSAVPARDTAFDWTQPVAGNTSATEWRDYLPLAELPQVLNPTSGWIVAESHAPAMAGLLNADSALSIDAAARVPFATHIGMAEDEILALALEWEDVGGRNPARARPLDDVLDTLRTWNHDAATGSTAATLFVLWQERLRSGGYSGDLIRFRALEDVMARLQRVWQTPFMEWGAVQRLQRTRDGSPFSDDAPSVAMPGAPGWTGAVFAVSGSQPSGTRARYATAGVGWVSVTELGPSVRSRSVVAFGQSANPASPHYFDQAELFVRGELKPSPFTISDVEAHARATYRPQATGQ